MAKANWPQAPNRSPQKCLPSKPHWSKKAQALHLILKGSTLILHLVWKFLCGQDSGGPNVGPQAARAETAPRAA